jgi:superfamily II DNA or RNA helicase
MEPPPAPVQQEPVQQEPESEEPEEPEEQPESEEPVQQEPVQQEPALLPPKPNPNPNPNPNPKPKPKPAHPLLMNPTPNPKPNAALQRNELLEWNRMQHGEQHSEKEGLEFLYPTLNDPEFAVNIAQRKEFHDTKYTVVIPESQSQMELEAAKLCGAAFELAPHQLFVRNFLSVMTPYNSLLLYHGLGTGKTCSAISVAEEMRDYMHQVGTVKKILVVASVNVQDNFRKQLFDFDKLKFNRITRQFVIRGCTGTKLLKDVGANVELTDLTQRNVDRVRDGIVQSITRLINANYEFMGYIELANLVRRLTTTKEGAPKPDAVRAIKHEFNHRLLIVDEIHNVRSDEEVKDAKEAKEAKKGTSVSDELYKLVRYADNLRLLLLSGTPMYNDPREIVWLLNLMNMNDRRATISVSDVFDRDGNLLSVNGRNVGAELLRIKSTGYISVVKGENPYIFPYRMQPRDFAHAHSFLMNRNQHPTLQLNGTPIVNPLEHLDVYLNPAGAYQEAVYNYIIDRKRMDMSEDATSFGSFLLKQPIEALNMVYPSTDFDKLVERMGKKKAATADVSVADVALVARMDVKGLLGDAGLKRVMKYDVSDDGARISNFEYKPNTLSNYGRIFSRAEIGKYSSKIASICAHIERANGIVLIYSEYIGGGAVPIALALEEMGFTRYDKDVGSLFKTAPVQQRMLHMQSTQSQQPQQKRFAAKYAMFTGDKQLSPDNRAELEALTTDNEHGQRIKVVIISKAGSEGIDFKNVRQVHIMEPWYNMNRIEQIIGRAVRNCSHADLPFVERNVQVFLYGTLLSASPEVEAADLYVYRLAETKAAQIGQVSRILKENAADCLLNIDQTKFSQEVIRRHNGGRDVTVRQVLADGTVLSHYEVGDRPFSFVCDYQGSCEYKCVNGGGGGALKVNDDTYSEPFVVMNADRIMQRIRDLFKVQHFYARRILLQHLQGHPREQVDVALTRMITDQTEHLVDKYGRTGRLVNVGEYYLFQPSEITNPRIGIYERSAPLQFKRDHISFSLTDATLGKLAEKHGFTKPKAQAQAQAILAVASAVAIPGIAPGIAASVAAAASSVASAAAAAPPQPQPQPQRIQEMKTAYHEIMAGATVPVDNTVPVDKNTKTWNDLCKDIMRELAPVVDVNTLKKCVVHHFLEELLVSSYEISLQYLNALFAHAPADEFDRSAREYFESQILKNSKYKGEEGILMLNVQDKKGLQLVVRKNAASAWAAAPSSIEWRPYLDEIAAMMPRESTLAEIIGYIVEFKEKSGGSYAVFKIKYVQEKGGGARCDQISSKQRRLTIVNQIMHGLEPAADVVPMYTMESTKNQNTARFCVLPEMLLRSYNIAHKDGKHWFLTPVQAARSAMKPK